MNPFRKIRLFYHEIIAELKKATWPTFSELLNATIIVIVAAIFIGVLTSMIDFSFYQIVNFLTEWVHPMT